MKTHLVLASVMLCGCASMQPGYTMKGAEGIKIVKPDSPGIEKLPAQEFSMPFEKTQDGTKLMLDYLAAAQDKGAIYASDIAITIHSLQDDKPVACATEILLFDTQVTKQERVYKPARHQSKYVYKPVTRMVTEREYQCRFVSKPHQVRETYSVMEYDRMAKRSRSVQKTRYVTRNKTERECSYQPITKRVTRYEHQYVSAYVPPKLEVITKQYTTWDLEESEPACSDTDALKPNTIAGRIYFPESRQANPDTPASTE